MGFKLAEGIEFQRTIFFAAVLYSVRLISDIGTFIALLCFVVRIEKCQHADKICLSIKDQSQMAWNYNWLALWAMCINSSLCLYSVDY